jgi:hypothetical protein
LSGYSRCWEEQGGKAGTLFVGLGPAGGKGGDDKASPLVGGGWGGDVVEERASLRKQ